MDINKNYYEIMGVTPAATEKDIKAAYRKLARKYHPDLNKEPHAEERFKEMGEAYEILKDTAKRAEYDNLRKQRDFHQKNQQRGPQGGRPNPHQPFNFDSDFFESMFGHARRQQQQRPMSGQNYQGTINISLEEAFNGAVKNLQLPVNEGGATKVRTLKVKVPAGIKTGQQIRLAGQGAPGINGGPPGDLFLTAEVAKHPHFDVMDNDIYLTLPITPWEAALGTTVTVPTLAGKIDLKIPTGSQGGQKLRIKDRGLPGSTPGNQYVLLKIITPPAATEEAKELYKKMAQIMPLNPRDSMGV